MICTQCGKNSSPSRFSDYNSLSVSDRLGRSLNPKKPLCNDCINHHQRPNKQVVEREISRAVGEPYHGPSSKEKKEAKIMQRSSRAVQVQPYSVIDTEYVPVVHALEDHIPVPEDGNTVYPNVLPAGSTFIPAGFARGQNTGLIIRIPEVSTTLEARCKYHSDIAGKDVFHPCWNFAADNVNKKTGLQTWCRAAKNTSAEKRKQEKSAAALERQAQVDEGRRLQDLEMTAVQPEFVVEEVVDVEEPATFVPHDVRVIIPEGMLEGVTDKTYLNIKDKPLTFQELQRAGLWLLTQSQMAQGANVDLERLQYEFQDLQIENAKLYKSVRNMESTLSELQSEIHSLKRQALELESAQTELVQTKEMLDITSGTLRLTEQENAALKEKIARIKSEL